MGSIKMVACVRKRADLTFEEFSRYWREDHKALVLQHLPSLRARRYAQNHLVEPEFAMMLAAGRGMETDLFDGVLELWWDSLEEVVAAFGTSECLEASAILAEDEARFIDLSASKVFLVEELIMFDEEPAPVAS